VRTQPAASVREKATGAALYARDLADLSRGTALVAIHRSPHAHARVLRVEAAASLAVPGVLGVLTGADFRGLRLGSEIADEPVLAEDRARYVGDHVAAVCAEDEAALRAGLAALAVEYEPLPAAFTPGEALGLPVPIHEEHPDNVAYAVEASRGDWAEARGRCELWVEDEFQIAPVQHAYMEPYAIVARHGEGVITLEAATHAPAKILEEYEAWAARGPERLEIRTPAFGGAFGAKYEHPLHLVCAEFARRLRRDVALVLSRREDFLAARPRVDLRLRVGLGCDRQGVLLAKEAEVEANNGAASGHGPSVLLAAMTRMDNLYRYRATRARGRLVYTNTPPTECYRGFGDPEAAFAQEQLVDRLARELELDPLELRRRNAVREGEVTVHGWRITSTGFEQCLDAVGGSLRPGSAPADPAGRLRRGRGFAGGMHVTSNRGRVPDDFAEVTLQATADGALELSSAEVDVGTGAERVLASLAAPILEVPPGRVRVVLGDTERGPAGLGSYASRTTFFAGNACLLAARELRRRADRLAAELGVGGWAALVAELAARGRLAELAASGRYVAEDVEEPDASGYGNRSPAYTFSVHGCEVEVDTWTGRVRVLRYVAAHDAGTVLDPPGARGQVIGGVLQGLGHALSEESLRGPDGRMLNPGFLDYRIPTALDSVPVEVVFSDTFDPGGPLGAKSLAEPPIIPVAACVANAIHDAVGVRMSSLPMTPERVLTQLDAR
jgi:CO/xanthine dehydrogenase Mo-binding subunit